MSAISRVRHHLGPEKDHQRGILLEIIWNCTDPV